MSVQTRRDTSLRGVRHYSPKPSIFVPAETKDTEKLALLRSRLLPLLQNPSPEARPDLSDNALSNWLKVCESNVLLAEVRIRKCLRYRQVHKLNNLLTEFELPTFAKYYPGGLCGQDKESSPVYYELFGFLSLKEIMESSTRQDFIKFKIYQHEHIIQHLKKLSRSSGLPVDTILVVVDMTFCNKSNLYGPGLRILEAVVHINHPQVIEVLQDLYPGLVKEILIINVHYVYHEVYMTLRPYLSRSTLQMIKVMGDGSLKHLLQRIDKHEIPAFLGGYKCDFNNNPLCMADLNWNTVFPQYFHLTNKRMTAEVTQRLILGGENRVEEYHVPTARSTLTWKFFDVSQPIVFSIYLNTLDNSAAVLRKTTVTNAGISQGYMICEKPGRYLLIMDNCKNYAHSTTLVFRIEVKLPLDIMERLAPNVPLGDTIDFWKPMGLFDGKPTGKLFKQSPNNVRSKRDSCW